MAFDQSPVCLSLPVSADLSTKQYLFVELANTGKVSVCNAAGEHAIGVLQDKPAADGRVGQVAVGGVTKVFAGSGGIDEGDLVTTDAAGKAIVATKATTDTTSGSSTDALVGSYVIGVCVKAAVADAVGSILITHLGAVPTTAA
jgi:hypothetical protein